jgi:hypothetical protein
METFRYVFMLRERTRFPLNSLPGVSTEQKFIASTWSRLPQTWPSFCNLYQSPLHLGAIARVKELYKFAIFLAVPVPFFQWGKFLVL